MYVGNYGNNIGDINTLTKLNDIIPNNINFIVEISTVIFTKNAESKEGSYAFGNTLSNGNIVITIKRYYHLNMITLYGNIFELLLFTQDL